MADRVKVTDPHTGVEIDVLADSPQAKAWGKAEKKAPATKRSTSSARNSDK